MIIIFIKSLIINQIKRMDNREIKKWLNEEKKQLVSFLKIAAKIGLSDSEIEKQINFYLDKINELKKKIKKI